MLAEIVERMLRRFAPGAIPAEPTGFAVGERYARDRARPVWASLRAPEKIDRLMKSAAAPIGTHRPPQWQRLLEQPSPQRRRLVAKLAHRIGPARDAFGRF